jgi:tetratricopeptide (TPR) repeat protein
MGVYELWDFDRPDVSESRFRETLASATGTDALILRTQLARALGLQRRFDECSAELDGVQVAVASGEPAVTPEVRTYLALERGRQLRSSGKPEESAPLFLAALTEAQTAGLDHLAADAAHMLAIIGTAEEQIAWARRALDIASASEDPRARTWIGSAANNLGWTLHHLDRHDEAQEQFETALRARMTEGDAARIRVARWTVARGLRALNRPQEALAIQTELAATGPEDGYVEEELGELLLAVDGRDEAASHFRRAHELLSADEWLVESEPDRLARLRELSRPVSGQAGGAP